MRILLVVFALSVAAVGVARAEGTPKDKAGVLSWIKNWKSSLERSAVEGKYRKMRSATGVAAVRGEIQESEDPLQAYWKDEVSEKTEKARMKERGELEAAASLVMEEKVDAARAALDAFEKAHPKSSFLPQVAEARVRLDVMEGKSAAVKPAPEPKPEAAEPAKQPEPAKAEAPKAEEPKAEAAPEAPAEPAKAEAPAAP